MPPSGWLAGQQHRLEVGLVRTDRVLAERVARPGVGARCPTRIAVLAATSAKTSRVAQRLGERGACVDRRQRGAAGVADDERQGAAQAHLATCCWGPPKSSPWRDMSHWSCSTTKRLGLFPGSSVSPRSRGHSLIGVNFPARRGRAPAARTSVPVLAPPACGPDRSTWSSDDPCGPICHKVPTLERPQRAVTPTGVARRSSFDNSADVPVIPMSA